MYITHRVSFLMTADIHRYLESIGVNAGDIMDVDGVDIMEAEGLVSLDIREDTAHWPKLAPQLDAWGAIDVPSTNFTTKELKNAAFLEMAATSHHGYPLPDDDMGYVKVTYDTTDYCSVCGTGAVQKAPFRMRKEPKWGKRGILQLNWVFDEFFCTPEMYNSVFKPLAIPSRPVLDARGKHELRTVVQLVVGEEVTASLEGVPSRLCTACGRTKYAPIARGCFPKLTRAPHNRMARTKEYFGSGGQAFRAVIVSQELLRRLQEVKARGVTFTPVEK